MELKLALEIDAVVIEGLFLRCCAMETLPDQEVVFQLEYQAAPFLAARGRYSASNGIQGARTTTRAVVQLS